MTQISLLRTAAAKRVRGDGIGVFATYVCRRRHSGQTQGRAASMFDGIDARSMQPSLCGVMTLAKTDIQRTSEPTSLLSLPRV